MKNKKGFLYAISHKSDGEFSLTRLAFAISLFILTGVTIIRIIPTRNELGIDIINIDKDFYDFLIKTFGAICLAYITTKIKDSAKIVVSAIKKGITKDEVKKS